VGATITFTASGVMDSGGIKRINCTAKQGIDGVAPMYSWVVTKPGGGTVSGAGSSAVVAADEPGTYTCVFTAKAVRECPPPDLPLPAAVGRAVRIHPVSVTFGGPDYKVVSKDDGTGAYPTPHWKDNSVPRDDDNADVGDHHIPSVYPRNTRMHLSAGFEIEPTGDLAVSAWPRSRARARLGRRRIAFPLPRARADFRSVMCPPTGCWWMRWPTTIR
jgi:hypothetical protein